MTLLTSIVGFWKLAEASGSRSDEVGSLDLTDVNTVTQADGVVGFAAQFNRNNEEELTHVDNASFRTGNVDFTFACWVRLDSKPPDFPNIISKRDADGVEYALFYANGAGEDRFAASFENPIGTTEFKVTANSFGSPPFDTFIFIVFWWDSTAGTFNIQVNNGPVDSITPASTPVVSDGTFYLGGSNLANQNHDGRIDAVGFWKKVLSASEKTSLYNGGFGLEHPFTNPTLITPSDFRVESRSEVTADLKWVNRATGHTATLIERAKEDGAFSQISSVGPTIDEFADTGLEDGTRYRYRLKVTDV